MYNKDRHWKQEKGKRIRVDFEELKKHLENKFQSLDKFCQ